MIGAAASIFYTRRLGGGGPKGSVSGRDCRAVLEGEFAKGTAKKDRRHAERGSRPKVVGTVGGGDERRMAAEEEEA